MVLLWCDSGLITSFSISEGTFSQISNHCKCKLVHTINLVLCKYSIVFFVGSISGCQRCVDIPHRSVPKFMKRMKVPDYKDKNVFGVPLLVHVQRYGQPLPLGLQQALRYLRSQCLDQVSLGTHALMLHMPWIFTCDIIKGWVFLFM